MASHQERNRLSKSRSKRYNPSLLNLATTKGHVQVASGNKTLKQKEDCKQGVTAIF